MDQAQENSTNETSDTSKYAPKNIPIDLIIDYIENKGLNQTETAKLLGCDSSNISRQIAKYNIKPGYLKKFKNGRADILAFYQKVVLSYLTSDKLKKASAAKLATIFGILYDKERLERMAQNNEHIDRRIIRYK